ncbi:ABC transporter ATP-binding protein [Vibrio mediterranei]|uniref:ABC transporter ATP-binding protein n=1 Tax=Vibrio barjaei TaxID=1676683 RepID=A0ABW7IQ90_9VIBR|nr:ABC transporter ATP-binding protein [Vibrio barjaei]MCG9788971.1 ABC transporter ATP-binding protein [Vibrio mediterranei]OIN24089.1 copper ABC transporter ATP-binding protein [Vibrio barjaei]
MSKAIVQLHNVSKQYKSLHAVDNLSFSIQPGEVLGLFGHNGAGKTTTMKLILGVIEASAGEVNVFGTDPSTKQAWQSRKQIGYLPENVSFYEQLTGLEVLTYFARLKSAPLGQVKELLTQVGLADASKRPVKTYSKGMRQRLGLAQAFLGEPKLLLLDEPTVGLDPIATQEFYQSVDRLKKGGASVLLCSHVLPGVEQHIDRALILSKGKAITIGTLDELRTQAKLPTTIRATGLNGAIHSNKLLSSFATSNNQLSVPNKDKIQVLRELLTYESLSDVQMEPANLEQIYQHFLHLPSEANQPKEYKS